MYLFWRNNKNVIMVAVAMFVVSVTVLLFLLNNENLAGDLKATVMGSADHQAHHEGDADNDNRLIDYSKFDHLNDGPLVVVGLDGLIDYANEDYEEETKYLAAEIQDDLYFGYVHPDDLSDMLTAYGKVLSQNEGEVIVGPYRVKDADGEYQIHMAELEPLVDGDKMIGVSIAAEDISDLMEDDSEILEAEIEELFEELSDFTEEYEELEYMEGNDSNDKDYQYLQYEGAKDAANQHGYSETVTVGSNTPKTNHSVETKETLQNIVQDLNLPEPQQQVMQQQLASEETVAPVPEKPEQPKQPKKNNKKSKKEKFNKFREKLKKMKQEKKSGLPAEGTNKNGGTVMDNMKQNLNLDAGQAENITNMVQKVTDSSADSGGAAHPGVNKGSTDNNSNQQTNNNSGGSKRKKSNNSSESGGEESTSTSDQDSSGSTSTSSGSDSSQSNSNIGSTPDSGSAPAPTPTPAPAPAPTPAPAPAPTPAPSIIPTPAAPAPVVVPDVKSQVNNVKNDVKVEVQQQVKQVRDKVENVKQKVKDVRNKVKEKVKKVKEKVKSKVKDRVKNFKNKFQFNPVGSNSDGGSNLTALK